MEKRGILLLNLGGPDTLGAVRPFLYNLFSDREIIRLGPAPLQKPIAWFISVTRSPKTRAYYEQIGGGSPIRAITEEQADALQHLLGTGFKVCFGMRYWFPFIEESIRRMYEDGLREILALSLYPHYSVATTGSAYSEVKRCLEKYQVKCSFAPAWYDNEKYIEALAGSVKKVAGVPGKTIHVLFSAHSLPRSFIDGGDPYVEHITATKRLVEENLVKAGYDVISFLSYQSRSGPVKWLEPSTDHMIEELGKKGIREVIVVPVSFVSDHIETLYEIDILYKNLAAEHGVKLKRTESLNTSPLFISALAEIVHAGLKEPEWV